MHTTEGNSILIPDTEGPEAVERLVEGEVVFFCLIFENEYICDKHSAIEMLAMGLV